MEKSFMKEKTEPMCKFNPLSIVEEATSCCLLELSENGEPNSENLKPCCDTKDTCSHSQQDTESQEMYTDLLVHKLAKRNKALSGQKRLKPESPRSKEQKMSKKEILEAHRNEVRHVDALLKVGSETRWNFFDKTVYLLSAKWLTEWKQYIDYEEWVSIQQRRVEDRGINKSLPNYAILYPGPISNEQLLLNHTEYYHDLPTPQATTNLVLNDSLEKDQDFYCVSKEMWDFLKNKYGGYEIVRENVVGLNESRHIELFPPRVKLLIIQRNIAPISARVLYFYKNFTVHNLKQYLMHCVQSLKGVAETSVRLWKLIPSSILHKFMQLCRKQMIQGIYPILITGILLDNYSEKIVAEEGLLVDNDAIVVEVQQDGKWVLSSSNPQQIVNISKEVPSYLKYWENNFFSDFPKEEGNFICEGYERIIDILGMSTEVEKEETGSKKELKKSLKQKKRLGSKSKKVNSSTTIVGSGVKIQQKDEEKYEKIKDETKYEKIKDETKYEKIKELVEYEKTTDEIKYEKTTDEIKHEKTTDKEKHEKTTDKEKHEKTTDKEKHEKTTDKEKHEKTKDETKYEKTKDETKYEKTIDEIKYEKRKETDKHDKTKKVKTSSPIMNKETAITSNLRLRPNGLQNIGNSCYINSAIQCLKHTRVLAQFFQQKSFEEIVHPDSKGEVCRALKKLFQMINEYPNCPSPYCLKKVIDTYTTQFEKKIQCDSHEFLTFLLNKLDEETRFSFSPSSKLECKEYEIVHPESQIQKFFFGKFCSIVECLVCHSKSSRLEPFLSISLPISEALEELPFQIHTRSQHIISVTCKYDDPSISLETLENYLQRDLLISKADFYVLTSAQSLFPLEMSTTLAQVIKFKGSFHAIERDPNIPIENIVRINISTKKTLMLIRFNFSECSKSLSTLVAKLMADPDGDEREVQNCRLGQINFVNNKISIMPYYDVELMSCSLQAKHGFRRPSGKRIPFLNLFPQKTIEILRNDKIADFNTLDGCLRNFFHNERLQESNRFRCETCKDLVDGVRETKIALPPQILVIHLLRFKMSQRRTRVKLTNKVDFHVNLIVEDSEKFAHKYSLYAVLNHHGDIECGHYTAYCRSTSDREEWLNFNDKKVTPINISDLQTSDAYVLFYELTSSHQ